jgi:uncharacterized glyoxalase superfamily protein PhnB
MPHIALTALVVRDYDEAISFYVNKLNFELREDTRLDDQKRWVVVTPRSSSSSSPTASAGLLLAKASTEVQSSAIGSQTGGCVGWFLRADASEYTRMQEAGLMFEQEPRKERYGMVAVFRDLYGNRWDLLGPSQEEEVEH